ncbi:MAG TPA: hypothetical protein VIY47_06585 [Ignavibacteriaceae bacterium]
MTNQQIQSRIKSGLPFFAATEQGEILARYIVWGPVFVWKTNQMIPFPLQGDDLLWWLQVKTEENPSKD